MKNSQIKIPELALLLALCVTLCHAAAATAGQSRLEQCVVRLHVIASDDSRAEQEIKMRVRDRVLRVLTPAMESAGSPEEAELALLGSLKLVEREAGAAAEGREVSVEYGLADYPTKSAEGCTLPAGRYRALRVIIGEGGGHNWWGVIFPCFTELTESDAERVSAMLGDKNFALISESDGGVSVRFRILELLRQLKDLWD